MASQKISAMADAAALAGDDVIPLVQGGANRKVSIDRLQSESRAVRTSLFTPGDDVTDALRAMLAGSAGRVVDLTDLLDPGMYYLSDPQAVANGDTACIDLTGTLGVLTDTETGVWFKLANGTRTVADPNVNMFYGDNFAAGVTLRANLDYNGANQTNAVPTQLGPACFKATCVAGACGDVVYEGHWKNCLGAGIQGDHNSGTGQTFESYTIDGVGENCAEYTSISRPKRAYYRCKFVVDETTGFYVGDGAECANGEYAYLAIDARTKYGTRAVGGGSCIDCGGTKVVELGPCRLDGWSNALDFATQYTGDRRRVTKVTGVAPHITNCASGIELPAGLLDLTGLVTTGCDVGIVGRSLDGVITPAGLAKSATPEKFKTTATAEFLFLAGAVWTRYTKAATDNLTFTAAHTIAANKYGVILIQIDAAGTVGTKVPAANQSYNTAAEAFAAVPNPDADALALGYLAIANNAGAWVANTDDLTDGSDLTTAAFVEFAREEQVAILNGWVDRSTSTSLVLSGKTRVRGSGVDLTAAGDCVAFYRAIDGITFYGTPWVEFTGYRVKGEVRKVYADGAAVESWSPVFLGRSPQNRDAESASGAFGVANGATADHFFLDGYLPTTGLHYRAGVGLYKATVKSWENRASVAADPVRVWEDAVTGSLNLIAPSDAERGALAADRKGVVGTGAGNLVATAAVTRPVTVLARAKTSGFSGSLFTAIGSGLLRLNSSGTGGRLTVYAGGAGAFDVGSGLGIDEVVGAAIAGGGGAGAVTTYHYDGTAALRADTLTMAAADLFVLSQLGSADFATAAAELKVLEVIPRVLTLEEYRVRRELILGLAL